MIVVNPQDLVKIRTEMGYGGLTRNIETTLEFFKEHNIQLDMYQDKYDLWVLTFDKPKEEFLFRLRYSEYFYDRTDNNK
jgi:hypothetical protein